MQAHKTFSRLQWVAGAVSVVAFLAAAQSLAAGFTFRKLALPVAGFLAAGLTLLSRSFTQRLEFVDYRFGSTFEKFAQCDFTGDIHNQWMSLGSSMRCKANTCASCQRDRLSPLFAVRSSLQAHPVCCQIQSSTISSEGYWILYCNLQRHDHIASRCNITCTVQLVSWWLWRVPARACHSKVRRFCLDSHQSSCDSAGTQIIEKRTSVYHHVTSNWPLKKPTSQVQHRTLLLSSTCDVSVGKC